MKKNDVRLIGLTGPTGAGKSTAAFAFVTHGIAVIDADAAARAVQTAGSDCLAALAKAFSPAILRDDGSLDRAALAALAFASPEATARLNEVTHPFILAEIERRIAEVPGKTAVLDAPLLFETGLDRDCDRTVAVLAPAETRLVRIMARDNIDESAARRRMAAQPDDAFYRARADVIVENTGDGEDTVIRQIEQLLTEGVL